MNEICEINVDLVASKKHLTRRTLVNGKYVPEYKLTMINFDVFYIECKKYNQNIDSR